MRRKPASVQALTELGRVRLSKSFFMRDMLHSEIAQVHGLLNAPDDPDLAIAAGTRLCEDLLEPLQDHWGRVAVRGAYRNQEVNALGNRMMRLGKAGYNCALNENSAAGHIWDLRDKDGCMGATACVVVPAFYDAHPEPGGWQHLARWIDENLPYSWLQFFPKYWAFNINWHERPVRRIGSYVAPKGRWVPGQGILTEFEFQKRDRENVNLRTASGSDPEAYLLPQALADGACPPASPGAGFVSTSSGSFIG